MVVIYIIDCNKLWREYQKASIYDSRKMWIKLSSCEQVLSSFSFKLGLHIHMKQNQGVSMLFLFKKTLCLNAERKVSITEVPMNFLEILYLALASS